MRRNSPAMNTPRNSRFDAGCLDRPNAALGTAREADALTRVRDGCGAFLPKNERGRIALVVLFLDLF